MYISHYWSEHYKLMDGALLIDRSLPAHQREEGPRGFVPVRMPERSADALLVDGAGRRVLDPGGQHALPGFGVGRIETWGESADHFRHRAAGRGQDGLAVLERFDQRQAVSFIARWIETECGVAVERRDCRIVGVGKDLERAGDAGIAAQIPHEVVNHPTLPASENQLEARALRNPGFNKLHPRVIDQAVALARLDRADEERITSGLKARGQWRRCGRGAGVCPKRTH